MSVRTPAAILASAALTAGLLGATGAGAVAAPADDAAKTKGTYKISKNIYLSDGCTYPKLRWRMPAAPKRLKDAGYVDFRMRNAKGKVIARANDFVEEGRRNRGTVEFLTCPTQIKPGKFSVSGYGYWYKGTTKKKVSFAKKRVSINRANVRAGLKVATRDLPKGKRLRITISVRRQVGPKKYFPFRDEFVDVFAKGAKQRKFDSAGFLTTNKKGLAIGSFRPDSRWGAFDIKASVGATDGTKKARTKTIRVNVKGGKVVSTRVLPDLR